jgi:peptide deformylase
VEVLKVDKKIKKFVSDMIDTLKKKEGLGLAAPQVGINKRIIIARFNYDTNEEMIVPMINPVHESNSLEKVFGEEGCLSLPGIYKPVERYKKIRIKFQDIKGNKKELELEDLNARIVQHEIDHLDGKLFIDCAKGSVDENDMSMITF